MNGRIYDPKLARFPQADPFVQAITSSQSLNRYSYGFNNPLNGTDPSGYDFRNFIVISIFYTVFDFITDQPPHEPTIPSIGNPIVDHVAVGTVGGAFGRSAVIPDRTSYTNVTVFDATTGETDSEQTGGKFANGASTEAFVYSVTNVADLECGVNLNCGTPPLAGPAKLLGAILKGAAAGLGRLRVALGVKPAANAGIKVTERGLRHISKRHTAGGERTAGKSIFKESEDIAVLIRDAESVAPVRQAGGNFQRTRDAGRVIGIDRATGQPTSVYTVITDAADELVTAFPGIP
jgi:hypothetical protein